MAIKKTTKILVLAEASKPEKSTNYYGDTIIFEGKEYYVNLSNEIVEFRRNIKE